MSQVFFFACCENKRKKRHDGSIQHGNSWHTSEDRTLRSDISSFFLRGQFWRNSQNFVDFFGFEEKLGWSKNVTRFFFACCEEKKKPDTTDPCSMAIADTPLRIEPYDLRYLRYLMCTKNCYSPKVLAEFDISDCRLWGT